MNRFVILTAAALLAAAAAWAAAPSARSKATSAKGPSFDDYQLILDRNIFSRDRTAGRTRYNTPFSRPYAMSRPSSTKVDYALVLTGIVEQDGLKVAFIEDSRSGETFRMTAGAAFAGGVLKNVSLEGVEFGEGENVKKFAVGESITGVSDTGFRPAATASGPSDSSANDILERMRLRRLQEMGK